jgi:hypothetical protein
MMKRMHACDYPELSLGSQQWIRSGHGVLPYMSGDGSSVYVCGMIIK